MHDTALQSGMLFAKTYGDTDKIVVDVGGKDVNGSCRKFFEDLGMKYICVDLESHESVDIVVRPGEPLPFATGSIDLIISTSCLEHDPCFWLTFREFSRIVKLGGYVYVNAPSNGPYHTYPGDNWRFYSDAGQALAYWSGTQFANAECYPMKVIETFHILPLNDIWVDWICIWQRVTCKETEITISNDVVQTVGLLESALHDTRFKTMKKISEAVIRNATKFHPLPAEKPCIPLL